MSDSLDPDCRDASAIQTQSDGLVVNIELTLISIIQAVARAPHRRIRRT
jgi:hypothetical protein